MSPLSVLERSQLSSCTDTLSAIIVFDRVIMLLRPLVSLAAKNPAVVTSSMTSAAVRKGHTDVQVPDFDAYRRKSSLEPTAKSDEVSFYPTFMRLITP